MCDLNNPTVGVEVRVSFQFLFLLTTGSDMGRIATRLHLFTTASIASIQTQILRVFFIWFRPQHNNMVQGSFQQFDIMCIGPGKNNCQRKSFFIRQHTTFCPHFFLGLLDFSQQTPRPEALLPYNRPDFATPNRFLPAHHIFPDLLPIFFQKILLPPILENIGECCSLLRILWALLSTDNPFAIHRTFPLIPAA